MSLWTRMANVARGERLNREIDEELESHIEEAIAHGRDPVEAHGAFASALRPVTHAVRIDPASMLRID